MVGEEDADGLLEIQTDCVNRRMWKMEYNVENKNPIWSNLL